MDTVYAEKVTFNSERKGHPLHRKGHNSEKVAMIAERMGKAHLDVCGKCVTLLDALRHLDIMRPRPLGIPGGRRGLSHKCGGFRCAWCGRSGRFLKNHGG